MKKLLILGLILCCLEVQTAWSQIMQTQPMSAVLHKLKVKGYGAIKQVDLKEDEYLVRALDEEGDLVEIRMNAHSGEIITMKKIDPHISIMDVVENIEQLGYVGITHIETKDSYFEVTAFSPDGKQIKLVVDAVSGKIMRAP